MTESASSGLAKQLNELSKALGFDTPGLQLSWVADHAISGDLNRLAEHDCATIICEVHDRDELGRSIGQSIVVFVLRRTERDHEQEPFYSYCDLSLFTSASEAGESALAICELFWWEDPDAGKTHRFDVSVEWPLGRRLSPGRELREVTIENVYGTGDSSTRMVDAGLLASLDLVASGQKPRGNTDAYEDWTAEDCRQPEFGS